MAIINSYPTTAPTGSDLIIGTDVSTTPNSTKTFTIDSINALSTGTPAAGTLNTIPIFTSAVALGDSTIVRSGAGATSVYTFGGGTAIDDTSITTSDLTTSGNTILGNAGTDALTVNAASTFTDDLTIATGHFFTCSAGATFQAPLTVNSTSAFANNATFSSSADIVMSNTSKILLGTTMTIEHPLNGNAIISEVGGGNLSLFSDDTLEIKSGQTGENFARFTKDGPIELYYDNVKKFSTVSAGVSIDNGSLTVQGSAGNNGQVTLAGSGVVNGTTSLRLAVGSTNIVSVAATGTTTTGQINIAALNTAPASATATGILGEIRFTADYIYVCVATDTWKRVLIATWT